MPKAAAFSPLQVLSPVQLVFCLILFFLPWIELSCTLPREAIEKADKAEIEDVKKKTGVDPTRPIGMVAQSGLQIATGKSSLSSDYKKLEEFMKKEMGGGGGFKVEEDPSSKVKDSAPLLFLYLIALVGGIVLGFVPWASPARRFIVLGCCLLALGVVGIQAAVGFPMERELKKDIEKMKGFGPLGGDAKAGSKPQDIVKVRWKFPLYLSLVLLVGAAATSMLGPTAPPPRRKRRRPRDEDDEDEDDRPRARRDYEDDDEDDEDDQPRRPRRSRRDDDD